MDTILITGANRGLGLEFVRQYAADDWRVLACCRQVSAELDALEKSLSTVAVYPLDVVDHDMIDRLSRGLAEDAIDVLLNNAGTMGSSSFAEHGIDAQRFGELDYDDWAQIMRVNVFAPVRMAEAFLPQVLAGTQKKIVTLTSMVGSMNLNTQGGLYAYRSSKAAVNSVMRSMAIDLADRGVLAIAIHPGWARTAMGGDSAPVDPVDAVRGVRRVISNLTPDDLGKVIGYDGEELPY
ncbi:MAG: SDR family oxidoreductase [Gammaproteobacteria bacterium]|nr:SDR family oxidoreductase [Gammaproteobacteria bacterium]